MKDIARQVGEIIETIDELRDKWERLDAHGSQSDEQGRITGRIERQQAKLKTLLKAYLPFDG